MRYLILALCLLGCGPARGDEPVPLTQAEFAKLQADLKGQPKKLTYTETVAKFEATVAGLAETVGNTNNELDGIAEELKAVKEELRGLKSLLTVDVEPAVPVPPAEKPVQADAPPVESAGQRTVTLNGKPLDVAATIKASYRRMWSFPGSIDSHLTEHGVSGFQGLDYETKRKLHSALHEMSVKPVASKPPIVMNAAVVVPRSNCPGGVCPNVRQYGYTQRRGLFGRAWR